MLASVELKKRENRDDLDFLQMNGYIPCSIYIVSRLKKITRNKCLCYRVLKQTNITKQMPKIQSVQQFTVWSKILSPHLLLIYTLVLLSLVDMLQSYHVISRCLIYNICSLHEMAEIRLTLALNTNQSINVSCAFI